MCVVHLVLCIVRFYAAYSWFDELFARGFRFIRYLACVGDHLLCRRARLFSAVDGKVKVVSHCTFNTAIGPICCVVRDQYRVIGVLAVGENCRDFSRFIGGWVDLLIAFAFRVFSTFMVIFSLFQLVVLRTFCRWVQ